MNLSYAEYTRRTLFNAKFAADEITGTLDPVEHLLWWGGMARDADFITRECVREARAAGATWEAIGKPLGLSRQAVQQRFGE